MWLVIGFLGPIFLCLQRRKEERKGARRKENEENKKEKETNRKIGEIPALL